MGMAMRRMVWVGVVLAVLAGIGVRAQVALDNAAVVKMVKAGMGEDLVLSVIAGQPGTYDLSTDALVELKKDGVSDKVIAAMQAKGPAVVMNDYDGLEIGVYYKDHKNPEWQPVPSEKVYQKTGGALKSLATHGIVKEDMKGRIDGQKSDLGLTTPLSFLIVTPEGVDATDFTLVALDQKKDAREFRTMTGGVFHSTTDVNRNAVPFTQKRVAKHTYKVILPDGVGPGEYAFLAAGLIRFT
jgi:hypothetical protein